MGDNTDKRKQFERLRQQAEEVIQEQDGVASQSQVNVLELIHELKVYQTELELQNEELQGAQQVLSDLHEEYQDLYEFAPCGYLTLTPQGRITRANLTAVRLLEIDWRFLENTGFTRFIENKMAERLFNARQNALDTGEKQTIQLALKSSQKSRDLSYTLHPPNLNDLGLEGALAELCQEMKAQYGLEVVLRVGPNAEPASRSLGAVLYRSARELLSNVVKHAGSNWAVLELVNKHGRIQLRVEDCGHGFDSDRIESGEDRRTGFGLYSIEERISSLGGSVTVDSEPGSGCSILLTVPQHPAANETNAGG